MARSSAPRFEGVLGPGAQMTYRFEALMSGRLEGLALALPFHRSAVILSATVSTAAIERSEAGLGLVPVSALIEIPELGLRARVRRPNRLVLASGSTGIQLLDLASVRSLLGVDVAANQYDLSTDHRVTGAVFQNRCRLVTTRGILVLGRARGQATFTAARQPAPTDQWSAVASSLLRESWGQVPPDAN